MMSWLKIPELPGRAKRRAEDALEERMNEMLAEEAVRGTNQRRLLEAVNQHHDAVMEAQYGPEQFRKIVAPCRVFGSVDDIGLDGGLAEAIEKIKRHAVQQAEDAVRSVYRSVGPAMYDVAWVDAAGEDRTTRMLTTAVYVLTEDEMSQLEALLTAHCRGISKEDIDVD